MPEYDNTNRGVIFKNNRKESDNHPDYTGTANIEGKEYWQSVWIKKSKNGNTFMSVSYKAKDEDWVDQTTRDKFGNKQEDTVITDIGDEPINLDDIPF